MEGVVSNLSNHLARKIWDICTATKVWQTAVHIPEKEIIIADFMSKLQNENTKWTLSQDWFSIKRFDFSIEKFSATLIVPKYEILGY